MNILVIYNEVGHDELRGCISHDETWLKLHGTYLNTSKIKDDEYDCSTREGARLYTKAVEDEELDHEELKARMYPDGRTLNKLFVPINRLILPETNVVIDRIVEVGFIQ